MKLNYFPDTDSLYIDLSHKPSVESQEVSQGVVLDYDGEGNLVGIDIDHASRKLDLHELVTTHIPLEAKAESLNRFNDQRCHALPVPPEPYGKGGTNHVAKPKTFDRMK